MSAETLRKAASLMRERAEAATPGPWVPEPAPTQYRAYEGVVRTNHADFTECADEIADTLDHADSAHIASWHPAVALAVADCLGNEADLIDHFADYKARPDLLNLATDYLGTERFGEVDE